MSDTAGTGAAASPTWGTALVTGASSGIGATLARMLAAEGTGIVAVARDKQRLDALAAELVERHPGVTVEVLPADLADADQLAAVEGRIADPERPVDLVVNNAGFGTYGPFVDADRDVEEQEIRVNVVALMRLTHAAARSMVARGRGAIVNVSSVAGLQAAPGNATYGATKAFVASFSEAVSVELRGTGVTLTTVLPGFTRTEFQRRAGIEQRRIPRPFWKSADDVAAATLAAARAGRPWLVTGALNKLAAVGVNVAPRGVRRWAAARVVRRL
ncbi:MAG TPA: SDR family oxidoreductase [Acidimicrobiales bacterium]|jgi:short-subunit dehydrogenase|nr:SDR family oxidoreductase [Acidimicrobiales bacterium]